MRELLFFVKHVIFVKNVIVLADRLAWQANAIEFDPDIPMAAMLPALVPDTMILTIGSGSR